MSSKPFSLPARIPQGARVVVRTRAGIDPADGRMKYSDYLGHVVSWDGSTLHLTRDPSRDGTRPAQDVCLSAEQILVIKPVPERREFPHHEDPQR